MRGPTLLALAACLLAGAALASLASLLSEEREQRRSRAELAARLGVASAAAASAGAWARLLGRLKTLGLIPRAERDKARRQLQLDSQLAMLLDVTALGMRAGMAFDQSFELALRRSSGQLAEICLAQLEIWQKGLASREQGLRELERQVQTALFGRFVALVVRALRYGAPMAQLLLALAEEARRDIRARREEEVAKAPVKMLIPTGALILPAMLLLVLGPIMLDLIGKM